MGSAVHDFDGVAFLYIADATAFPPGSGMVKGRAAIAAMWKSMAEQVSDPKFTTLEVKRLGPSAAREIGTFSLKTKGPTSQEVAGKYVVVWEKVGRLQLTCPHAGHHNAAGRRS
jgi:ketosteroid isomerase-like protein